MVSLFVQSGFLNNRQRTALSSLAPASSPYFLNSFSALGESPGSLALILAAALSASPRKMTALVKMIACIFDVEVFHTLKLGLCCFGVAACAVEIVADTTGGTKAEDQGQS